MNLLRVMHAEARRLPLPVAATPMLLAVLLWSGQVATLAVHGGASWSWLFAMMVPVVALVLGLVGVAVMVGDRMAELLSTVATSYAIIQFARWALLALLALISAVMTAWLGLGLDQSGASGVLGTASTSLLLLALPCAAGAWTRSASAVTMTVIAAWLLIVLFIDPNLPPSLSHAIQVALALALLSVTWFAYQHGELPRGQDS